MILPGMPRPMMMAANKTPPSFRSSSLRAATATSAVISRPSGTAEGDLLLVWITTATSATINSVPSGWTQEYANGSGDGSYFLYSKVAGPSEPTSYTFGFSSSIQHTAIMACYQQVSTMLIGPVARGFVGATINAPSVSPAEDGVLLAFFNAPWFQATITSAPSGMTQRASTTGNQVPMEYLYDEFCPAGASGVRSATWSTASAYLSGQLVHLS